MNKLILLLALVILFANVSCAQQRANFAICQNQTEFPNADLDNFEPPTIGRIKEIQIQEQDLEDSRPNDSIQTIKYDEQGRKIESFQSNKKIKVYGRRIPTYNANNRLIKAVDYNTDGSAILEDIYVYDEKDNLKEKTTRNAQTKVVIWKKEFTFSAKRNYAEFFDVEKKYGFGYTKDEKCRITEIISYKLDKTPTSKIVTNYDDKNNLIEQVIYSPVGRIVGKKKIEYELDNRGSWVKATKFDLVSEDGKVFYKPLVIVNRKITYFDTK